MQNINDEIHSKDVFLKVTQYGQDVAKENDKLILNKNNDLLNILVIDGGIKNSQIRALLKRNVQLTIVDINYYFLDEYKNNVYDGIFLSNGPGNPERCVYVINQLKEIFEMEHNADVKQIPIFGICLGHQIMSLANGAQIQRMKYGNRGHNIPVRLSGTNRGFITSQNHGYGYNPENIMKEFLEFNDNSK